MTRFINDVYESLHGKFLGNVIDRDWYYRPFNEYENIRKEILARPLPGASRF